jgi:quercetin dioxygenase-like cupin family protein
MRRSITTCGIALAVLVGPLSAAQLPSRPGDDPGLTVTSLIDRAEMRASRVDVEPGAFRALHSHDDVEYAVWIPIQGQLQLTIGSAAPVSVTPWQTFFLKRGEPHGFKNVGTTPASVVEVFVKPPKTAAARDARDALASVLAGLGPERQVRLVRPQPSGPQPPADQAALEPRHAPIPPIPHGYGSSLR